MPESTEYSQRADRLVIGGGFFGVYAALCLARMGNSVILLERDDDLMLRASRVNQARLHTGGHYPRSFLTAHQALSAFSRFSSLFPQTVVSFDHIYGIASFGSRTTAHDFSQFLLRLGLPHEEVKPATWFRSGTIEAAFRVNEPGFDPELLRQVLVRRVEKEKGIRTYLNTSVVSTCTEDEHIITTTSNGMRLHAQRVVICGYASLNSLRRLYHLKEFSLQFELTELLMGRVSPRLAGLGFTIMDGQFLSLMPYGSSGRYSLSNVGYTPLMRSEDAPTFPCQSLVSECSPADPANCNRCPAAPKSAEREQLQHLSHFLRETNAFQVEDRMLAIKTVLKNASIDDGRPTVARWDDSNRILTILAGKVSNLVELEGFLR